MQTSLSLPHTRALSASFTLHPSAISACFFSSLFLYLSLLLPYFHLSSPFFFLPLLSSLFQILHWSSVRPGGSVSYHPRHRPHHHRHGTGSGTRALAQHYCHRHPERSEVTLCTTLETSSELFYLGYFFYLEIKLFNESSISPPLTPAPTDEYESLRGLKKCNAYTVWYQSAGFTVWCTSLSGLALESSGHEGNAVWRHK